MNTQRMLEKVKEGVIFIAVGAIAAMIPFYFQTSAMTTENKQVDTEQTVLIERTQTRVHALELQEAVDVTEIKQIKESLQRIEKKIDRLIEHDNTP